MRFVKLCWTILFSTLAVFISGQSVTAQDAPEITVVSKSADGVMEDLEYLLKISHDPGEWKNVKNFMDAILDGLDTEKPIRMDVLVNEESVRYRPAFPVNDMDGFEQNLLGWGIKPRLRSKKAGLYDLKKGFDGWMRRKPGTLYAWIGENNRDVPAGIPDAREGLENLLSSPYELWGRLKNKPVGVAARHLMFARIRKEALAALQPAEGETKSDFEKRKTSAAHSWMELERLFAESEMLKLSGIINNSTNTGLLDLELKPLSGTEMAASAAMFNKAPSHFANMPQSNDAVLSARVNFPLDSMRQKHSLEMLALVQKDLVTDIENHAERTTEQKTKAKAAVGTMFQVLERGVQGALLDMAIEMQGKDFQSNTFVGGIRTAKDGDPALLAQALADAFHNVTVEKNVAEVAGVKIDKVSVPGGGETEAILKDFLGGNSTLYMGGDARVFWIAGGEKALDNMKTAIEKVAQPNQGRATDPALNVIVKAGPWTERRARRGVKTPYPETRKLAREAFAKGSDTVTMTLRLEGDTFRGRLNAQSAILKFLGSMASMYSRDNLQ